jgi:DNA-binding NtrC family response regulator
MPVRHDRLRKLDAEAVRDALVKTGGNKAGAARMLGVGRATLYRFLGDHSDITASASN